MNILFDITNLGMGYSKKGASSGKRSGIYRVLEEIATRLIASPECHVTFYSEREFIAAQKYLQNNPVFQSYSIPEVSFLHRVEKQARYKFQDQRLSLKVVNKGFSLIHNALHVPYLSINRESLAQADIVHATYFPFPGQTRGVKGLKRIITIYDIIPILFPQYCPGYPWPIHEVLESMEPDDWVIAISQSVKNDLCEHQKLDPERIFVTPLAADPTRFYACSDASAQKAVRQKYGIPEGPYLLGLSNQEPRKNIPHVIRCFLRLLEQEAIPDLNLVLAGAKVYDYSPIFQELQQSDMLKQRVLFTGYVADEDLAALYSGSEAFVYMSHYEGFGLPPLEAMQCGAPVITSNTSSLPEVVGEAGVMLDPNDADGLCQAMLSLHNDPLRRKEMSQRSLQRAALFSWQQCAKDTIAAYKQAVSS